MSKGDHFSPIGPFSAANQPDEGYSEDPLNPNLGSIDPIAALASLRTVADRSSWLAANASRLPVSIRTELTMTLLDELPTSEIARIVQRLHPRLYIDFIRHLPPEICLKILGYIDPSSLVSVMKTCRAWYDLALDRKLWERLYYLEGWKAVNTAIIAEEAKINIDPPPGRSHSRSVQISEDGHKHKIRALLNDDDDDDLDMTDVDRKSIPQDDGPTQSIFGPPAASPSINEQRQIRPMRERNLDHTAAKGIAVERALPSSGFSSKRKEPGGSPEGRTPARLHSERARDSLRSTLWTWDLSASQNRINWKYIYNLRRRLESNWELAKFTTFQLPHPNYPEEGHRECIYTLQFNADYVVSGSRDQTMRIWNLHTKRLLRPPLAGHSGSVLCLQFDADPEEDLLVSGSSDSNVFIWKFSTGELMQKITKAHRESVLNVRFDKRILVTSSKDKSIKIFNRRPLRYGDVGYGAAEHLINPVPQSLKRYGYEPDLAQELPVKPEFTVIGRLDGHSAAVNAIQVRDRIIVSVSGDRQIKIWNWPDQVCTRTVPAHDKGIACVEFDGRRIVSGSSDYEVCIFDAPTGLKVASLRGHAHLVRTVQAGFGDMPFSEFEDEAEARAVDARYFRAVEAGEIDHEGDRRERRSRRGNAGSSQPTDLQAFGAKLPPGGGGSRRYGRIVSGSYDHSIIIWRRDIEGVWKPAHHLRQEEAAAIAQRQAATEVLSARAAACGIVPPPHPLLQHLHPNAGVERAGELQALPGIGNLAYLASLPIPSSGSGGDGGRQSPWMYMALIEHVIPLGPGALEQALTYHPGMLAHHNYIDACIERESPAHLRGQLRQIVTDAMHLNELLFQNSVQASNPLSHLNPIGQGAAGAGAAGPSVVLASPLVPHITANSHSQATRTASLGRSSTAPGGLESIPPAHIPNAGGSGHRVGPSFGHRVAQQAALQATQQAISHVQQQEPHQGNQQPAHHGHASLLQAPVIAPASGFDPASAQAVAAAAAMQAQAAHAAGQHHPHIAGPDYTPGRIFKLQFDARRILCCSHASVIVGWDFCNGDPELEEVAKFFATVD